jgi:hypothetical protein
MVWRQILFSASALGQGHSTNEKSRPLVHHGTFEISLWTTLKTAGNNLGHEDRGRDASNAMPMDPCRQARAVELFSFAVMD